MAAIKDRYSPILDCRHRAHPSKFPDCLSSRQPFRVQLEKSFCGGSLSVTGIMSRFESVRRPPPTGPPFPRRTLRAPASSRCQRFEANFAKTFSRPPDARRRATVTREAASSVPCEHAPSQHLDKDEMDSSGDRGLWRLLPLATAGRRRPTRRGSGSGAAGEHV